MIYLLSPVPRKDTIHLPIIKFTTLNVNIDLSSCDYIFFTSKQAVKSAEELNPKWKELPCLAVGNATATQIEELGGKVVHLPKTFYAKSLSSDILQKFRDKNILYLRPQKISFDTKGFLSNEGINLQEHIIYQTSCIAYTSENKPCAHAIIIFTSPSTIECFLKNFEWDDTFTAIVIGASTKKYLPKNAKYFMAEKQSIEACIDKAKSLL